MSQRSLLMVVVLLLLLAVGVAGVLIVLVREEPAWYAAAALPRGEERSTNSTECFQEMWNLYQAVDSRRDPFGKFSDTQINSFFQEDFLGRGFDSDVSGNSITDPRVAFDKESFKLGFRYGHGLWSSIVSFEFRVWLPRDEANVVALELEGFHAGALPISAQSLLEQFAEIGRKNGIDVNWYRHNGHPVALLRFQPDQPRPTFQLQAIRLEPHSIMIQGRLIDSTPGLASDASPKPAPATP